MEEVSMSYGERGDRVSASRRRLNEARHRDGLFSPPSEGCTHRGRCDCQSCCSEDKSSGKEVEGAKQHLVASPPCDTAGAFSDYTKRPFVRRPSPPDDGGRGEEGQNTENALYYESEQHSAPGRGGGSKRNSGSSIDNRDESSGSRCLGEEEKWGSESASGSGDGVETHVVLGGGGGDSKEKSLRLRVAGDFVSSVFSECSSAVAWSTSRSLK
ncbi:unnamed protein product [Laminaria digitata]